MEQGTLTLEPGFDEQPQLLEAPDTGVGTPDALADRPSALIPARPATNAGARVSNDMECFSTDDPELILKARRLMADVYLKRDFVTPSDITDEGVLSEESDPYGSHSTYYVVVPKIRRPSWRQFVSSISIRRRARAPFPY